MRSKRAAGVYAFGCLLFAAGSLLRAWDKPWPILTAVAFLSLAICWVAAAIYREAGQ